MMDLEITDEEQLIQKHKKEKKELQAQIQVLKKSICKGDKKKKKEVAEEIAKKEAELDKKQNDEIANLKLSQVSLNDELETDNNESEDKNVTQKLSKAKKRREKKAKEEQERNKRLNEVDDELGQKNIELQSIRSILLKRDLMIYEIPSDGHCLYNAVAHQLKIKDHPPISLQELRTKTANYLRDHKDYYLPFLTNPDSESSFTEEEFEKYCNNIAETSAWGGDVELQVMSNILQCPIEVIQATSAPYIVGNEYDENKKIIVTYHRHMYSLGEHYNSVTKYIKPEE